MLVVVWFICIVVVNTIYFKLSEEPGLVKRFGTEYKQYRQNVPMWIPRLKPWRKDPWSCLVVVLASRALHSQQHAV